jgi:hypothetical protein
MTGISMMFLGLFFVVLIVLSRNSWKIPKKIKLLEEEARVEKITQK